MSNLADQVDQGLVRLAGLWVEARDSVSEVSAVESRVLVDLAGEEPLPSGLKGTKPIPSSSRVGINFVSGSLHQSWR